MRHDKLTFDELIDQAQRGDVEAVAYILLEAKYLDYTFNFHLRKVASKYFKYGTAELFDGLVNDLYIELTKNDFRAIKSFSGNREHSGEHLKRIFFSWLMITASRYFNEVRRKYLSKPECNIDKCVVSVPAAEYSDEKDEYIMLSEAIAKLGKEEQRIVLEQCLLPGKARRSSNVAKALTEWRQRRGNMREATEAEVNCIKSRAYIELRPILIAMGCQRVMHKKVQTKSKSRQ